MNRNYSGSELICLTLERLGITHVFGLPGTQTLPLFEALRCSDLRTIAVTHEASAGFMANGYFRASGRIGVLATISGPGFTNVLTALAEARHDSVAALYLVNMPPDGPRKFKLHALDQAAIGRNIAKAVFTIDDPVDLVPILSQACLDAVSGEPGPVVVQLSRLALTGFVQRDKAQSLLRKVGLKADGLPVSDIAMDKVIGLLGSARRPVIYAGQGCDNSAGKLAQFAELVKAPVIMTRSARGVIPMDHPLAVAFDSDRTGAAGCSALLSAADLVLVLGCKLGHNGTAGYRVRFPSDKTVQVDASTEVLAANYAVNIAIQQDIGEFLNGVLARKEEFTPRNRDWTEKELAAWRSDCRVEWGKNPVEPAFPTLAQGTAKSFFDSLRAVLPRNAILVTDSGLHQVLSFRYWRSMSPAGIIAPRDFQSMGFALSAAIGAKLACPEREVVAILGDGGLAMSGLELITAVREKLDLTAIIFNDGALGQIRLQQLATFGAAHATELLNPDMALFAKAIGARDYRLEGDAEATLRDVISQPGVKFVEVPLGDSKVVKLVRARGLARRTANKLVGRNTLKWVKSRLTD